MYETGLLVLRWGLLAAISAFCFTTLLIQMLAPVAPRLGLIAEPGGRKTHSLPTPVIGGLAIAIGALPVVVWLYPLTPALRGLGLAAGVLLTTGVIDDRIDLKWYWRLCAQTLAALILFYVGGVRVELIGRAFGFTTHTLGVLSAPFTVLATVGLINALNMADGIDGLAGTIVALALAMLSAASVYAGNVSLATGLLVLLGSVCAFLMFNLRRPGQPRAQVFLGNAGSEVLGLVVAWACFRLTQNVAHPVTPVLAPFLAAPPVIDCLVLMIRRARQGRSPFSADRNHMHHLLGDAGLSPTGIVTVIGAASVLLGLAAAVAVKIKIPQPVLVIAFLGLTAAYYVFSSQRDRAVASLARLFKRLGVDAPSSAQPVIPGGRTGT